MACHGVPRATGDLDVWVDAHPENAARVWRALVAFGAPVSALGVREADLAIPGTVVQIGLPPRRIDILTAISGVEFEDAWTGREIRRISNVDVPFLGRADLTRNKRASGRAKDLADLEILEGKGE